jgi:iron only hydrogenase large subunit-like protein
MSQYPIYTAETECRDCYKCVDRCPVKAIRVQNGRMSVISKMCIFCGNCVRNCPASAKKVRGDVGAIKKLFERGIKVYASVAPSFPAEFFGFTPAQFVSALKRLGFHAVSETALGADYVSARVAADLKVASADADGQKLFLSSACPAVVLYLKRYAAAFVPYLNDRASPLLAHAQLLRTIYGDKIGVVFIGPCIAKKREADQFKEVNAVITFDELKQWLREENINPADINDADTEGGFVPRRAAKGAFYPVDGGMILSMRKYRGFSKTSNMVISGIRTITETLNAESHKLELESPLFLELLACEGGCINGPCTTRDASAIKRRALLLKYAESADDVLDTATAGKPVTLTGELAALVVKEANHSPEEIRAALAATGKYGANDEINCSKCGYENCRAFAKAILEKRAEKTMCATYVRNLAQKKANALIDAMPSGVVIVDKNMRVIECNKNFARLMGSEIDELYESSPGLHGLNLNKIDCPGTYFEDVLSSKTMDSFDYDIRINDKILHLNVYVIEKGETVAGVFTDITVPQIRRDRTVLQAKKIIETNVKTVQKIAFLLGENAANTEAILNSIIESHTTAARRK